MLSSVHSPLLSLIHLALEKGDSSQWNLGCTTGICTILGPKLWNEQQLTEEGLHAKKPQPTPTPSQALRIGLYDRPVRRGTNPLAEQGKMLLLIC